MTPPRLKRRLKPEREYSRPLVRKKLPGIAYNQCHFEIRPGKYCAKPAYSRHRYCKDHWPIIAARSITKAKDPDA